MKYDPFFFVGPLFSFDVHEDVRLVNDASVERDEVISLFIQTKFLGLLSLFSHIFFTDCNAMLYCDQTTIMLFNSISLSVAISNSEVISCVVV